MVHELLSLLHSGDVIDSPPLSSAATVTEILLLLSAATALACLKTAEEILMQ